MSGHASRTSAVAVHIARTTCRGGLIARKSRIHLSELDAHVGEAVRSTERDDRAAHFRVEEIDCHPEHTRRIWDRGNEHDDRQLPLLFYVAPNAEARERGRK